MDSEKVTLNAQALLNISQKIMDALAKAIMHVGCLLTLKRHLITVDHEILIKKLSHYGIRVLFFILGPILLIGNNFFLLVE